MFRPKAESVSSEGAVRVKTVSCGEKDSRTDWNWTVSRTVKLVSHAPTRRGEIQVVLEPLAPPAPVLTLQQTRSSLRHIFEDDFLAPIMQQAI